jgi:hypothetical protein
MEQILPVILRNLATIAGDPALGYRGASLIAVLNLMAVAIEAGVAGYEEIQRLKLQVDEMVAQGREPTKAEWSELRARSEAAHLALQPPLEVPDLE